MVRVQRPAVRASPTVVAIEFDVALVTVVTVAAKGLPVGPVEEEGPVTFMALDVVYDRGFDRGVFVQTAQLTQRMFGEELKTTTAPSGQPVELAPLGGLGGSAQMSAQAILK